MIATSVPRMEYAAALLRANLHRLADRVARWLSEAADWRTGIVGYFSSARRIAYEVGSQPRLVYLALRELKTLGWLEVIERDRLQTPRYACTLPPHLSRRRPAAPPHAGASDERPVADLVTEEPALAGGAPPALPPRSPEPPPPQTLVGRLFARVADAVVRASGGDVAAPAYERPLPRDLRLELLDDTPQARELAVLRERDAAPVPEPPPELAAHLGQARHVGPLYRSKEEAARARSEVERQAQIERANAPPGQGDAAPHRAVVLELRRLWIASGAEGWSPSQAEHRCVAALIRRWGLDATLALIRYHFEAGDNYWLEGPRVVEIAVRSGTVRRRRVMEWEAV